MTESQITTKDVVLALDKKVDGLIRDMADVKVIAGTVGTTVTQLADHEMRLRVLERFRYAVPSATFVAALAAVVSALYVIFH